MKKLFTLFAFLALFMGAKAANWVEVASIDFSTYNGYPHYVMGYVPEWVGGVMTDYGGRYKYAEVKDDATETSDYIVTTNGGVQYYRLENTGESVWHQYFVITGFPTQIDGRYKVVAYAKASEAVTVSGDMRWSWDDGCVVSATSSSFGTEWAEVEWEFSGIGGSRCDFIAQPNTAATIEWQWVKVYEDKSEEKPITWLEMLTDDGTPEGTYMGDANTAWGDRANTVFTDTDNTIYVCAWSKEKGHNMNDDGGWDPFPAEIVADPDDASNKVFVCHGQPATTEGDASAWDNQFWIMSTKELKVGVQYKFHFKYRASEAAKANTQMHSAQPSDYLHYAVLGDVNFTTQWQEYDAVVSIPTPQNAKPIYSIAFNLNAENKNAIEFYFDDLSISEMKLEHGYFVAGSNTKTGLAYDFDNAIKFEEVAGNDDYNYVATIGGENADDWVNEIMISTVSGNTAAFKSNTLKPTGTIVDDPDTWLDYDPKGSSLAKLKLPAAGQWTIYLDDKSNTMAFEKIVGEDPAEPVAVITNTAVITVNATEREYTAAEAEAAGVEAPSAPGAPWDNQFFIKANRILNEGEVTVVEFDYVATKDAKVTTQGHALPGNYRGGGCGEVNFTTTEAHFKGEFKVPAHQSNDIQSIAFNLSEIKDANDYTFKNFKWYLKDESLAEGMTYENLIDETGTENNFSWKVLTGIFDVINDATTRTDVIYNLSGQRVSKDYKGVVIMNGRKVVNK